MNSYENAPATKLVACYCACCGRPLVDAISVETGVGPDCRERHGYGEAQGPASWDDAVLFLDGVVAVEEVNPEMGPRAAANKLVYGIAVEQEGEGAAARLAALRALGFARMADRIAKRLGAIKVEERGGELVVRAPWNDAWVAAACAVPGRRWSWEDQSNVFPRSSRRSVWEAIKLAFPTGTIVEGSRGFAVL